jgi:hypothetical protein
MFIPLWIVELVDVSNVGSAVREIRVVTQVEYRLLARALQPLRCISAHRVGKNKQ